MQSSSWEANTSSTSQTIPRILWDPKVHYRIYKRSSPFPILSQINPVQDSQPHVLKTHIILSSRIGRGLPSGLFSSHLPTKTLYAPLLPRPSHFFYLVTRIIRKANKLIKYTEIISRYCGIIRHTWVPLTLKCIVSTVERRRISVILNIPKYENSSVLQYHVVSARASVFRVCAKTGSFSVGSVTICQSTWRNIPDNRTNTQTAMQISYLAVLTKPNSSYWHSESIGPTGIIHTIYKVLTEPDCRLNFRIAICIDMVLTVI